MIPHDATQDLLISHDVTQFRSEFPNLFIEDTVGVTICEESKTTMLGSAKEFYTSGHQLCFQFLILVVCVLNNGPTTGGRKDLRVRLGGFSYLVWAATNIQCTCQTLPARKIQCK